MIFCPWKNHTTRSRPYEFSPIEKRQYLLAFQNHTIFPLFKNRTISVPLKNPTNGRLFLAWWTTMRFVTLSKPYRFLTVGKQHDSWPAGKPLDLKYIRYINIYFYTNMYKFSMWYCTNGATLYWVSNPLQLSLLWLQAIPKGQHLHPY